MGDGDGLIEIDPELYMNCRLCIKAKGKFQITPQLQDKIKYAFEIDVHLFDGLSQIICEKCRTTVTDYCAVKEQFQAKQKEMLLKSSAILPQQANTENGEAINKRLCMRKESDSEIKQSTKKTKKAKKKVILSLLRYSTSSSDEEYVQPPSPADSDKSVDCSNTPLVEEESDAGLTSNWKDRYTRSYVCRYCDKKLTFKNSMRDHVRTHESLRRKNRKLTKWPSIVHIERFEDRSNLTGNNDVVVLSPNKLITDANNHDFYVVYTPASLYSNPPSACISSDSKDTSSDFENSDAIKKKTFTCVDVTSDDEVQIHRPKLRKRIRLQSTSSEDTVNLEANTFKALNECSCNTLSQNIDKAEAIANPKTETLPSDYETMKQLISDTANPKTETLPSDYETIKQIISDTLENRKKRRNIGSSNMNDIPNKIHEEDILKRKILSIDHKMMYKQGYTSIDLLKYLKQRHLRLQWTDPTMKANTNLSGKDSTYIRIQTKLMESYEPSSFNNFMLSSDPISPQNETIAERQRCSDPVRTRILKKGIVVSAKITPTVKKPPLTITVGPQVSSNTQVLLPPRKVPLLPATSAPLLPALTNTTLIKTSGLTPISITGQPRDTANFTQFLKVVNVSPIANPKMLIKKIKMNDIFGTQNNTSVSTNMSVDHNYTSNFICLDSDDKETPQKAPDAASTQNETLASPIEPQVNLSFIPADILDSSSYIITNSQGVCMPIITSTESLANIVNEEPPKNKVDQSNDNKVPRIKCKPVSALLAGKHEQVTLLKAKINKSSNTPKQLSNGKLEIMPLKSSEKTKNVQKIDSKLLPPDSVVLHSMVMPYIVTNEPFEYFAKLLRQHTLFLTDSYGPPEFDYVKLVKFKLGVSQYPISVMLYLSLETYGSRFRIIVKNNNVEDIKVRTMLALWQWEILKAFNQPSVTAKIKQGAEKAKVANITYINIFLTTLESIHLVSVSDSQNPSHSHV